MVLQFFSRLQEIHSRQYCRAETSVRSFNDAGFYWRPDPVAQVVEHLTFNQRVLGSSPSGVTGVGIRYIGALAHE